MFLPRHVEDLQHHRLFEMPDHRGAGQLLLLRVGPLHVLDDTLTQGFLVQLVFQLQPLSDRHVRAEFLHQRVLQTRHVPLLVDAARRDIGVNDR